ncbi:hypothetical protein GCM10010406_27740 [Streptomyces thermolineatus]|uniref:Integral membrane protein n=1 Tax=Streptomyces thermolineatus TaxID=44033 RepID=A0ABN3LY71_9ACTN
MIVVVEGERESPVSTWRERVRTRANYLQAQADRIAAARRNTDDDGVVSSIESIRGFLEDARKAAEEPRNPIARVMRHSAEIERAWTNIHAAEVLMLGIVPEEDLAGRVGGVVARARSHLAPDDPRLTQLLMYLETAPLRRLTSVDRSVLASALEAAYQVEGAEIARVRSLRNILWATTLFVFVGLAVFTAYMWKNPSSLSLCFKPSGAAFGDSVIVCPSGEYPSSAKEMPAGKAAPQDVVAVEIAGLAGAALTVVVSLRQIPGTNIPYGLSLAAAVLKFPTGALTAVLGILLVRGGFIPGLSDLDSRAQLLAWAVAFGISQHLVTRLVDQRAQKTLAVAGKAGDPDLEFVPARDDSR